MERKTDCIPLCLPGLSPRTLWLHVRCLDAMNRANGDMVAHFRTVSPSRHSFCCTRLYTWKVMEMKNEKRERIMPTLSPLDTNRCVKWAWLSDCLFWKVTEIVGHRTPNLDVQMVWGNTSDQIIVIKPAALVFFNPTHRLKVWVKAQVRLWLNSAPYWIWISGGT